MKIDTWLRCATALGMTLVLAGCVQPTGPIFGDWHGRQPSGDGVHSSFVDLVLQGSPGDHAGRYQFRANQPDATLAGIGNHTLRWSNHWTLQSTPQSGSMPILELHNLPNSQISRYALRPDNVLVPLNNAGQPSNSRYNLYYALKPVPKSNYSYGRV